jgi:hypothetical protein
MKIDIIIILGIVFTSVLIWSFPTIRKIIRIWRTPIFNIGTLPSEGLVEIIGRAEQENVTSPISQKKCVAWMVEIQQEFQARGSLYWDTILRKTSFDPFELSDGTGKVWGNPTNADMISRNNNKVEEVGWFHALKPDARNTITLWGIETKGILGSEKKFKIRESRVSKGEDIFILGVIGINNGQKQIIKAHGSPAIISDFGKAELVTKLCRWVFIRVGLAALACLIVGIFLAALQSSTMLTH